MLFIVSAIATSVPLATMGTFFYFQRQWGDKEATKYLGWLPIVCLIVFFITYSGGMSNVPFIIMGEMFPTQFRSLLGAIASSFQLFCTFVAVYFFPNMLKTMGKDGTFFFFTGCTLLSAIFVYFLLPETKGKTLEDIEQLFSSHNSEQRKSIYVLDDIVLTEITKNGEVFLLRRSVSNGSDNSELQLSINKLEFASAV
jgi:facilitated trehalose transporter